MGEQGLVGWLLSWLHRQWTSLVLPTGAYVRLIKSYVTFTQINYSDSTHKYTHIHAYAQHIHTYIYICFPCKRTYWQDVTRVPCWIFTVSAYCRVPWTHTLDSLPPPISVNNSPVSPVDSGLGHEIFRLGPLISISICVDAARIQRFPKAAREVIRSGELLHLMTSNPSKLGILIHIISYI